MSRTYRRAEVEIDCNCGAPYLEIGDKYEYTSDGNFYFFTCNKSSNWYIRKSLVPERICTCGTKTDYYSKRNLKRDRKPWGKPNKIIKVIGKKERRAKEKNAMAHKKYEDIPFFKRTDVWDWS